MNHLLACRRAVRLTAAIPASSIGWLRPWSCIAAFIITALFCSCTQPKHDRLRFTHIFDALAGPQNALNVEWVNNRVAAFRKLAPQIGVELEQCKWDAIDTKCMADFRSGIAHDVVVSSPQLLAKHNLVGDLLDLRPLLNWNEDEEAEFSWNPMWQTCRLDGKLLGMPMGAHTRLCVYNKEMFRQVGLDPEQPPRDLQELVEYARKLTRDLDGDGKTDVWGLGMYFGPSRANFEISFSPLLWHFGGRAWDEESKQATFASEAGVHAVEFLRDLIYKYKVTPRWSLSGTYDDVILRSFLNEKIAIGWGWGSYWTQALEDAGWIAGCVPPTTKARALKAGIFLTPTANHAQFVNSWTLSVHKLTAWPEISAEFLQVLLEPNELLKSPDAGLPAQLSVWQRPEFQTPFFKVWFEAIKTGQSMPPTGHFEELGQSISVALQEIMVKNAPAAATLQKFQQDYNNRYAGE